jgi:DHA2 family multidrug resistance protein
MAHFNLYIDYWTAASARIIQAGGLAFLFIPINTTAYAFVPRNKSNQASALINLARNLGGSVGIAISTTLLSRYAQINQNALSAHMTATSPAFQESLRHAAHNLVTQGVSSVGAGSAALQMLYLQLLRQSSMLAYIAVFRFMAVACLLTLPLVFLLKPNRPKEPPVSVH